MREQSASLWTQRLTAPPWAYDPLRMRGYRFVRSCRGRGAVLLVSARVTSVASDEPGKLDKIRIYLRWRRICAVQLPIDVQVNNATAFGRLPPKRPPDQPSVGARRPRCITFLRHNKRVSRGRSPEDRGPPIARGLNGQDWGLQAEGTVELALFFADESGPNCVFFRFRTTRTRYCGCRGTRSRASRRAWPAWGIST
jgi:hypothetical protein